LWQARVSLEARTGVGMDNTGELKLVLPELEDDWAWRVRICEPVETPEEIGRCFVFQLTRGVWRDNLDKLHHGEVWNSGFIPINYRRISSYSGIGGWVPRSYDEIITDAQQEVDNLYDRWQHRETTIKTNIDALAHIVETVQSSPGVTQSHHFYEAS
jgi:hypothetical protein